ncbi:hypothetical protein GQ457_07G014100 [Hibiscus cannabinus]
MFTEEELRDLEGLKRGSDFIEVKCGCTSKKYGDTVGKLRVFSNGQFLISCECTSVCGEDKLTPYEFEKHSGKEGTRKWKNRIWVMRNGKKVPLWRTALLKYYRHASNGANELVRMRAKRLFHRDEFIRCTKCKKERRFRLRTDKECQSPAKVRKSAPAGRVAGAALDLRLAKAALPVSVSGATSAGFWIASAAPASISSKTPSLEL